MGTTKNRNGMDLTEAGDIEKRWQEYTQKNYTHKNTHRRTIQKKDLHDPDNHNGVITHLESGIKGTFHAKMGSIKDRNGIDLTEAEDIKKR